MKACISLCFGVIFVCNLHCYLALSCIYIAVMLRRISDVECDVQKRKIYLLSCRESATDQNTLEFSHRVGIYPNYFCVP